MVALSTSRRDDLKVVKEGAHEKLEPISRNYALLASHGKPSGVLDEGGVQKNALAAGRK